MKFDKDLFALTWIALRVTRRSARRCNKRKRIKKLGTQRFLSRFGKLSRETMRQKNVLRTAFDLFGKRKQITFSERNSLFPFGVSVLSTQFSELPATALTSKLAFYTVIPQRFRLNRLKSWWFYELISPPVCVLNVEQSESLLGCPSEPTTARLFYDLTWL